MQNETPLFYDRGAYARIDKLISVSLLALCVKHKKNKNKINISLNNNLPL